MSDSRYTFIFYLFVTISDLEEEFRLLIIKEMYYFEKKFHVIMSFLKLIFKMIIHFNGTRIFFK